MPVWSQTVIADRNALLHRQAKMACSIRYVDSLVLAGLNPGDPCERIVIDLFKGMQSIHLFLLVCGSLVGQKCQSSTETGTP